MLSPHPTWHGVRWLAVALFMGSGCALHQPIATRGKPAVYTIVIPAAASASQQYAATELQSFTEQMTGVKLPIATDAEPLPRRAILLGDTRFTRALLGGPADLAALGNDGFRLKTCPPHVLILGSSERGTLYGVYELLERFGGCRWYASWHSVIPRREVFDVPDLEETQVPAFTLREPFWFDFFDGDLAARNKCNGNAMRLTEQHGGKIRFGKGLFVHTFNRLCPPDEFFETHPEYFSEINGQRVKDRSQLCLSNPDVVKIVTDRLLEQIRQDPGATIFSVSQNDWKNACTCPNCRAVDEREGSPSGSMLTFVNQVAEAVEKEFPTVWIETLAYQYTRKPPKTVRPRRNVVIRLCTIECDFSHPLTASAYESNRTFVEEIQAWSAITPRLFIWDYVTNFRNYIGPFPNLPALQENIKLFRDHHVTGLLEQGAYQGRHGEFAELKAWLLARWMWNPDLPAEPLLNDFLNGYYGAAAPWVRRYLDELQTFYNDPATHPLRISHDVTGEGILPIEFMERSVKLWDEAEAAVSNAPPPYAYHVRMSAIPTLFAWLQRMPKQQPLRVWVTDHPERYGRSPEIRKLATSLLARFEEAGNIRISERMERHEQILSQWREWAQPVPLPAPCTRAVIEDDALTLARPGIWGERVADPLATDGFALKLFNTHYEWCVTLPFQQVAFDPGVPYRLRMRVRVEKEPGREGNAFWTGIYDRENKKSMAQIARRTDSVEDGYVWYEVARWIPEASHFFWIGPGRFDSKNGAVSDIRALFVDQLELTRVD